MIFEDDSKGNLHSLKADRPVSEKFYFTAGMDLIRSKSQTSKVSHGLKIYCVHLWGFLFGFGFFFSLFTKSVVKGNKSWSFIKTNSGAPLFKKIVPEDSKTIKDHEKLIKCRLFWKTEVQGHWTPHCNSKGLAQLKLWDLIESGIAVYQMNHSSKGDHGSCGLTGFFYREGEFREKST